MATPLYGTDATAVLSGARAPGKTAALRRALSGMAPEQRARLEAVLLAPVGPLGHPLIPSGRLPGPPAPGAVASPSGALRRAQAAAGGRAAPSG